MSTKAKLLAMTGDLALPGDAPMTGAAPADPGARAEVRFPPVATGLPKAATGPGQMLQFRGQLLGLESELAKAKERLEEHEGASPERLMDPTSIVESRWSNRHSDSFKGTVFQTFKEEIAAAGGNIQAISVRPTAKPGSYEIVFGHRRHRACLELGLPVRATVVQGEVSDLDLFAAMDRENRQREDLTPYEQGVAYRRALDEGLYPSMRRLAEALGVSHTWVRKVLLAADLPAPVLSCFRSPLEVQHRHAQALTEAFERDRKAVLKRAEKLAQQAERLPANGVVRLLLGVPAALGTRSGTLQVKGQSAAKYTIDGRGRLSLRLEAWTFAEGKLDHEVLKAIDAAIGRQ